MSLRDLRTRFENDPSRGDRRVKTRVDYAMLFRLLKEVWGPGKAVREINREDCRQVRDVLAVLPANARKRFAGMTLVEAAQHAERQGLAPMNPITANGHLNKLSTLLRWAEREEYIDRNPAVGFKIATPTISKRCLTSAPMGQIEGFA